MEHRRVRDPLWQIKERIVATLDTVTIAEMAAEHDMPGPAPVAVMSRASLTASASKRI